MSKRCLGCGSHIFDPILNLRTSLELGDTLVLSCQKFSIKLLTSLVSFISHLRSLPLKVHKIFVGSHSKLTLLFIALSKVLQLTLRYPLMLLINLLSDVDLLTKAIVIASHVAFLSLDQLLFLVTSKALAIVDTTWFKESFLFLDFAYIPNLLITFCNLDILVSRNIN